MVVSPFAGTTMPCMLEYKGLGQILVSIATRPCMVEDRGISVRRGERHIHEVGRYTTIFKLISLYP
jgi:hypothetical protein